ncbi:hypothetical protein ACQP1P_38635 [Dactylosporangium sp. CA-052675]|uniref:hypothetical protein n=1 Tax=Dactylosporangium sp. CA-052675 TaxID=3239927 RepID=UPI003D91DF2B
MPSSGTTGQRGYGLRHKTVRASWSAKVDRGEVDCARCGQPIEPGRPWDLGHTDDRTDWTGPEHRTCNRRAGGANGAAVTNAIRTTGVHTSREW